VLAKKKEKISEKLGELLHNVGKCLGQKGGMGAAVGPIKSETCFQFPFFRGTVNKSIANYG